MIARIWKRLTRPSQRVLEAEQRASDAVEKTRGTKRAKRIAKEISVAVGAAVLAAVAGGCTTANPQAPQIPLAPVYQAGSPVVVIIAPPDLSAVVAEGKKNAGTASIHVEEVGHNAKGDVGAQGTQETSATTDTKTDAKADVSGIPGK